MNVSLWLSATDDGDGSVSVYLNNTKEEALANLDRESEEDVKSFYDDGLIKKVSLEIDEFGFLMNPFYINIE